MTCNNIKCPHYRGPAKRDFTEKRIGVTSKIGGCNLPYCKMCAKLSDKRHR